MTLKQQINNKEKARLTLNQSRWNISPAINGNCNTNLNFKRSTNQNNDISDGNSQSTNYGVGASMRLFGGLSNFHTIAANKYNLLAMQYGIDVEKNQLNIEITNSYLSILLAQAQVNILQQQLDISLKQADYITAFVESGRREPAAIDEVNAIVSKNKLALIKAENNLQLFQTQLAQLIEIPDSIGFEIKKSEFINLEPIDNAYYLDSAFLFASDNMPQIKQKEFEIRSVKKQLSVSRGALSPSVTLNGGYYSGFYSTDLMDNGKVTPFNTQFTKYLNPYVGVSINIPIFNKFDKRYDIKRTKIDIENAIYALDIEKKQMRKIFEEMILQKSAFYKEYQSAKNNFIYTEKSFNANSEKYQLGLINNIDYLTVQNQLTDAKLELENSRLQWILNEKIIKLYINNL